MEDLKFVSDPMLFGRHIAELDSTNHAMVRSYVWGLDLSQTLDSAGGVGGLLWVRLAGGPAAGTHFVTYDGNGNVWQLVYASTGTETARYEYGPFGEPLRATGPGAPSNPFRFSTKRADPTTRRVLYEYRAYSPSLGRWLSRELVAELGARDLYVVGGNRAVGGFDALGLQVRASTTCGASPTRPFMEPVAPCASADVPCRGRAHPRFPQHAARDSGLESLRCGDGSGY